MIINISLAYQSEVMAELAETDKFSKGDGPEDDDQLIVGINGQARKFHWYTVLARQTSDIGVELFPLTDQIISAFVFRSEGCYGFNSRFRSTLRFFIRNAKAWSKKFLVFDVGEVGNMFGDNFHALDPFATILKAKRTVRVRVKSDPHEEVSATSLTLQEVAVATVEFTRFAEKLIRLAEKKEEEARLTAKWSVAEMTAVKELVSNTKLGKILGSMCAADGWPLWTQR